MVQKFSVEGLIRSVEVTVGKNGWHTHLHVLVFTREVLSENEAKAFGDRLFQRWSSVVAARGLRADRAAQDVQVVAGSGEGARRVSQYLSKQVYTGLGHEVASGALKHARGGNRTPFQVLAAIHSAISAGEEADARDLALWGEFELASLRRRQTTWSRGLRERLCLEDERSDEELAETETAEEAEAEEIGRIAAEDWKRVLRPVSARLEVLHAVEEARTRETAIEALRAVLEERFGIEMLPAVPKVLDTPPEDTCALPVVSDEDMAEHVRRLRSGQIRKGARAVIQERTPKSRQMALFSDDDRRRRPPGAATVEMRQQTLF